MEVYGLRRVCGELWAGCRRHRAGDRGWAGSLRVSSSFGGEAAARGARSRAMRGDGATHCRSPESPWLSIVLVDALWSPAVTTRLAPAAPGRPQPAQVLDRRSEHEHSAAPPIRRSRPRCFTPRWRGAPNFAL